MSTEIKVSILSKYPFTDRTDPKNPKNKISITFQTPDNRILSTEIDAAHDNKPEEDKAIVEAIKKAGPLVTGTKTVKI